MTRPTLRETTPVAHAAILGIGAARGERVVTNDDIAGPINSSDEWIRQRTGIITRRYAEPTTSLIDLAAVASDEALADAGISAADVDLVLVATGTHFLQMPAAAPILADRIGATPAAAYDLSGACAGYCYAIGQADALVRSGAARHVLVVGAEKMSDYLDPTERSISFLLGDGAGAVVVGPSPTPGISPTVWGSDGSKADAVAQNHSWLDVRDHGAGHATLRQDGPTVFKWAVWGMLPIARQTLEEAGITPDQLDAFIPHQANMRIIDQLVKQLGLPETVAIGRDIADQGNSSAASVPLAMHRLRADGEITSGDIALQIGFGAGLVYAAQVVVVP